MANHSYQGKSLHRQIMAMKIPSVESLLESACKTFEAIFDRPPEVASCAPGRVNLAGGGVDYSGGFVFPVALPLVTVVVGGKAEDSRTCRIKSMNIEPTEESIAEFLLPSNPKDLQPVLHPFWLNYVIGVVANFHAPVFGFDAVVFGSVPLGGGLSSSAALEVAVYTFLEVLMSSEAPCPKVKVLACQKAEHEYAKVPCGIMDQFASTVCVKDHAILIDCRSLASTPVPLKNTSVDIVIINSNIKHSLSKSEYPLRRKTCFDAAKLMGKKILREILADDFEAFKPQMDAAMVKRVRHVLTENDRTLMAAEAAKNDDFVAFGNLMIASQASLKYDYEVSCPEIDQLVDIALSVPGVLGTRLSGGGFGGCIVSLVKKECVDSLIDAVKKSYTGEATFYVCSPSDGARILKNYAR